MVKKIKFDIKRRTQALIVIRQVIASLTFSESDKYGNRQTNFAIQNETWGVINLPLFLHKIL